MNNRIRCHGLSLNSGTSGVQELKPEMVLNQTGTAEWQVQRKAVSEWGKAREEKRVPRWLPVATIIRLRTWELQKKTKFPGLKAGQRGVKSQ